MMAILFMEGWEDYSDIDDYMDKSYYNIWRTDLASGSLDVGRSGSGQSLRLNTSADDMYIRVPTSSNVVWGGFAFKTDAVSGSKSILRFHPDDNIASYHIELGNQVTGLFTFYRGGTLLGTSTTPISGNTWYYLEYKITIDDTAGSVDLWVDGVNEISVSGVDTKDGNANVSWIELHGNSNDIWYDDFVFGDDTGSDATDNIGVAYIEKLSVNGAGSSTQFTPEGAASPTGDNYQNVDDSSPDDNTTYNYSNTVGHKDFFTVSNLTTSGINIHAVGVNSRLKRSGSTRRTIRTKVLSNATEGNGTTNDCPTKYLHNWDIFENDPDTGSAWTESAVDAMEIGYEVVS